MLPVGRIDPFTEEITKKEIDMKKWMTFLALPVAASVAIWLTGCPAAPSSTGSGSGATTDDHGDHAGHDHGDHAGHDHGDHAHDKDAHAEDAHAHHHHGPHGGHIGMIGKEEYHVEWTHEGGLVTFYILDAEAKKEVPIAAEKLIVEVKVGDSPTPYELPAVNPQGDDKTSAQFAIEDKELEGALEVLSKNVTATIKDLTIGDKSFGDVKVEEHDHGHDHGHGEHK
jgi:hypothetical protein